MTCDVLCLPQAANPDLDADAADEVISSMRRCGAVAAMMIIIMVVMMMMMMLMMMMMMMMMMILRAQRLQPAATPHGPLQGLAIARAPACREIILIFHVQINKLLYY